MGDLWLDFSYSQSGTNSYTYFYQLTNKSEVAVFGFSLAIDKSLYTSVEPTSEWNCIEDYGGLWWNSVTDVLLKDESIVFSYTSNYAPSTQLMSSASAIGMGAGFIGQAYAPVPEASSMMLAFSGLAGVEAFKFRRFRR